MNFLALFGLLKRIKDLNHDLGAHKGLDLEKNKFFLENTTALPFIFKLNFFMQLKIKSNVSASLDRG